MKKSRLLILTAFLFGAIPARSQRWQSSQRWQGSQRWQQQVNYSIDVTLTDSTHSLDGTIQIEYLNHSPDTLSFIWIRCWPNAFKNDRTAFSEQLIRTGRTDFYFSDKSRKGYLNRLEFRADGRLAQMEDHPQFIDVIKVILPNPLSPGDSVLLTTPFHVQLPDNFSNSGFHEGIYQVTQWYPKPAVFDNSGWHPDPYLGQGGAYNEFGDFDVRITVPANLTVAATGKQQSPTDPASPIATKTLHFRQSNIPDFAWFASRRFHSTHDTLQLPSGRIIDLYSYYVKSSSPIGRLGIEYMKDALRYHSTLLGDYPFDICTAVETRPVPDKPLDVAETRPVSGHSPDPREADASYPTLIGIDGHDTAGYHLEMTIQKEISDNWLSVAIGADGRRYPWMTEGISNYYYTRYRLRNYRRPFMEWVAYIPDTVNRGAVNTKVALREDQPVSTSSEDFTPDNYRIIAGYKTAIWMLELQRSLGTPLFDSCMHEYFRQQQFQHTRPEDLKAAFVTATRANPAFPTITARINIDSAFALLDTTGPVPPSPFQRPLKPNIQFIPHQTRLNTLNVSPALGFNNYDHLMIGALIHNYNLPPTDWQLAATALYSPTSRQWNGLFHFNYAWYPRQTFRRIEAGINGSRFSTISGTDSNNHAIFGGFYKVVPYIRFFLRQPSPNATLESWLEAKTYLIGEKSFDNYVQKSTDTGLFRPVYPVAGKYDFRYLNQLAFSIRDIRVLYPWSFNAQIQQAEQWYRINLDLRYFFNYASTGGLAVRVFGAKFGYLGARTPTEDLTQYEPQLTAVLGDDDYTYGNYFIGRNDFSGLASQQIMLRDGDLKLRADQFPYVTGRSDNWVASINLNSSLPPQIVPAWLPLHLFLDIGTYAGAWSDNSTTSHFLYVGGLELDLFHDVLHIYAPLVYCSDFSILKTDSRENNFLQRISFSIDFQNLPFRKLFGYTPF